MARCTHSSCSLLYILISCLIFTDIVTVSLASRSFPISPAQAYRKKLQDSESERVPHHDVSSGEETYNQGEPGNSSPDNTSEDDHVSNIIDSRNEVEETPSHLLNRHPIDINVNGPSSQPFTSPRLRVFTGYSIANQLNPSHSTESPPLSPSFVSNVSSFNEIRVPVFVPSISYESNNDRLSNDPSVGANRHLLPHPPPPPPPPPPAPAGAYSHESLSSPYFPTTVPLLYPETMSTPSIPDSYPPGPIDDSGDEETARGDHSNSIITKPGDFERKPKRKPVIHLNSPTHKDENISDRDVEAKVADLKQVEKHLHLLNRGNSLSHLSRDSETDERQKSSIYQSVSCLVNDLSSFSRKQIQDKCQSHLIQIERLKNDCLSELNEFIEFTRETHRQAPGTVQVDRNVSEKTPAYWWRSLFSRGT